MSKDGVILVSRQLFENGVRLTVVCTSGSEEETGLVGEHILNFIVRQIQRVFWIDECVTTSIQTHLAVHLLAHMLLSQPTRSCYVAEIAEHFRFECS